MDLCQGYRLSLDRLAKKHEDAKHELLEFLYKNIIRRNLHIKYKVNTYRHYAQDFSLLL